MQSFDIQTIIPVAVSLAVTYGIFRLSKIGSRDPCLPPGPPTIPILGNLTMIPVKNTYIRFTEWARQYGGIYSLKVGNANFVVVSSLDAINEVFERNGAITANRPKSEPIRRIAGPQGLLVFAPYGPMWRVLRKAASELMKPSARERITPIQTAESTQLLLDCIDKPDMLFYHLERCSISTTFSAIGGVRLPQVELPLNAKWHRVLDMISKISEPGNAPPVDLLPILNYIPDRFARNWKSRCNTIRDLLSEIVGELVDSTEERLKRGKPNGCFLELMEQKAEEWNLDREGISSIVGALLIGSNVSTVPLLHFVVLLAAGHPTYQRKVQEEIDRVVGTDRPPMLEDLPKLPYLSAFMKEVHRFRPAVPLAMPHFTDRDQIYKGYLIPKDSTLFLNVWGLNHDPDLFEDPDTFNPDRFIHAPYGTKSGLERIVDPELLKRLELFNFGAGRRRCVGMPLAQATSNLVPARLFWAFNLSPALDDDGNEIPPDYNAFESGAALEHRPFKLTIKPRSTHHVDVIKRSYSEAAAVFDIFERGR